MNIFCRTRYIFNFVFQIPENPYLPQSPQDARSSTRDARADGVRLTENAANRLPFGFSPEELEKFRTQIDPDILRLTGFNFLETQNLEFRDRDSSTIIQSVTREYRKEAQGNFPPFIFSISRQQPRFEDKPISEKFSLALSMPHRAGAMYTEVADTIESIPAIVEELLMMAEQNFNHMQEDLRPGTFGAFLTEWGFLPNRPPTSATMQYERKPSVNIPPLYVSITPWPQGKYTYSIIADLVGRYDDVHDEEGEYWSQEAYWRQEDLNTPLTAQEIQEILREYFQERHVPLNRNQ